MIPSSYFSSTAKANKKSGGPPIPSTLWLQVCHGPPIINPTKTKKKHMEFHKIKKKGDLSDYMDCEWSIIWSVIIDNP
jgi:hypothetical protein